MTAIAFFYVGQLDSVCCLRHLKVQMSLSRFACLFLVLFCKKRDTAPALPYPACGGPAALLQGSSDCTKEGAARRGCMDVFAQSLTDM